MQARGGMILVALTLAFGPADAQETGSEAVSPTRPEAKCTTAAERAAKAGRPRREARRPRNPENPGSFAYLIKDIVRVKSSELCATYGRPGDCIDEVEVCITMLDQDDDVVRLCLNNGPGERSRGEPRQTSLRR
jgi:hypothetical protein